MNALKKLFRAIGALIMLAAILVGLPWALLRYGNWPITSLPTKEWLRHLNEPVSDSTLYDALTVAVWCLWAIFSFSVLVEFGSQLARHSPAENRAFRAGADRRPWARRRRTRDSDDPPGTRRSDQRVARVCILGRPDADRRTNRPARTDGGLRRAATAFRRTPHPWLAATPPR